MSFAVPSVMPALSKCSAPSHQYASACIRSSPPDRPDHDAATDYAIPTVSLHAAANVVPRPCDWRRGHVATPSHLGGTPRPCRNVRNARHTSRPLHYPIRTACHERIRQAYNLHSYRNHRGSVQRRLSAAGLPCLLRASARRQINAIRWAS